MEMLQLIHKYDFAKYVLQNNSLCPSGDITLRWLPLNLVMKSIFGVGNDLLPSINMPLPEPRLTPINVTIWHLKDTLSLLVAYGYLTHSLRTQIFSNEIYNTCLRALIHWGREKMTIL